MESPRVAVLAESAEAWAVLEQTGATLERFGVAFTTHTLDQRADVRPVVEEVEATGVLVWIVGNTSTTSLAGEVAEMTNRPVLAVPLDVGGIGALDALEAATAGGRGPVASLAVGKAGAVNAALFAVAILANGDARLRARLEAFRREQTAKVLADGLG